MREMLKTCSEWQIYNISILRRENGVEYRIVVRYWKKDGTKVFYTPCESDSFYKRGA